jgi:hypothetical protein
MALTCYVTCTCCQRPNRIDRQISPSRRYRLECRCGGRVSFDARAVRWRFDPGVPPPVPRS